MTSKDPSPLKVKQVIHDDTRYIVCVNSRQARKDAADRQAIVSALKEQLKKVALKYKELWRVERVFRDVKTLLETRPIFHQRDENIRGHVFCSFPALVLRKELERRLNHTGHVFEWSDIKQDLDALQTVTIEED